jgi:2-polyprenyl-6-methoxyphenol hydroxylase-like FAD-dependent oxidoreductase
MRAMHDAAILGGGPAGIACALRAADAGLSVLLCDPQAGAFDKPCGEGILPAGVQVLHELGIASGIQARPFAGIRYCVPGAGELEMDLGAPGEAWWRTDLHQALEQALAARPGVLRLAAHATAEAAGAGFRIRAGGQDYAARHLVAADGAGGRAAYWLRPAPHNTTRPRPGARAR